MTRLLSSIGLILCFPLWINAQDSNQQPQRITYMSDQQKQLQSEVILYSLVKGKPTVVSVQKNDYRGDATNDRLDLYEYDEIGNLSRIAIMKRSSESSDFDKPYQYKYFFQRSSLNTVTQLFSYYTSVECVEQADSEEYVCTKFNFTKDWKIFEKVTYNKDLKVIARENLYYDEKNRIEASEKSDTTGKSVQTLNNQQYFYNKDGQLEREELANDGKKQDYLIEYQYNENKQLVRRGVKQWIVPCDNCLDQTMRMNNNELNRLSSDRGISDTDLFVKFSRKEWLKELYYAEYEYGEIKPIAFPEIKGKSAKEFFLGLPSDLIKLLEINFDGMNKVVAGLNPFSPQVKPQEYNVSKRGGTISNMMISDGQRMMLVMGQLFLFAVDKPPVGLTRSGEDIALKPSRITQTRLNGTNVLSPTYDGKFFYTVGYDTDDESVLPKTSILEARVFKQKEVTWKRELQGVVDKTSAVIFDKSTLYLGTTERQFYAIDNTDGTVKWKRADPSAVARGIPAQNTNLVFFSGDDLRIIAFTKDKGVKKWEATAKDIIAPYQLAVYQNRLLVITEKGLFQIFNTDNGKLIKEVQVGVVGEYPQAVYPKDSWGRLSDTPIDSSVLYFGMANGDVMAFDMVTLQELWRQNIGTGKARLVHDKGRIFAFIEEQGELWVMPVDRKKEKDTTKISVSLKLVGTPVATETGVFVLSLTSGKEADQVNFLPYSGNP